MLVKDNKINKKKDFDYIFKNGKSAKSVFFILRFLKNKLGQNRFAFVVSKKVSPKAVVRNRIRRLLSESVKEFRKESEEGMDIIFIALPAIKEKSFVEIKKEADRFLGKII